MQMLHVSNTAWLVNIFDVHVKVCVANDYCGRRLSFQKNVPATETYFEQCCLELSVYICWHCESSQASCVLTTQPKKVLKIAPCALVPAVV